MRFPRQQFFFGDTSVHSGDASLCGHKGAKNLGRGELGHGLGALGDGVLGELTGEDEAHGGLDLPGGDRRLLVVARELGGLGGDLVCVSVCVVVVVGERRGRKRGE